MSLKTEEARVTCISAPKGCGSCDTQEYFNSNSLDYQEINKTPEKVNIAVTSTVDYSVHKVFEP